MDKTIISIILVLTAVGGVVAGTALLGGTGVEIPSTTLEPQDNPGTSGNSGDGTGTPSGDRSEPATETTPGITETPVTTPLPEETVVPEETETTTSVAGSTGTAGSSGDSEDQIYPATRTLVDMNGDTVTIPYNIEHVVTLYTPAAAMVMAIDGDAHRLCGIDYFASIDEGFQTIYPAIADISVVSGTGVDVNKEAILATNPDVIIAGSWSASGLEGIGVPVIYLNTNGFDDVDSALTIIGEALGRAERAETLVSYLQNKRAAVTDLTGDIPANERDNLYLTWGMPLRTFAGGGFHQNWAQGAGCDFASAELTGNRQNVNLEQVIAWDPEIIVLANSESPSEVLDDPEWQSISAVRHDKVYRIPRFVGDWGSPVPESVLGMMWIANGTYHDVVDLNMVEETQDFYRTFYGYGMGDEQAREVIGATPAPHIRTVTVTDGLGRAVKVELPVERVATGYGIAAKMITTLGAGDRIVGANNPGFNVEEALSLNPDLIVIAGWDSSTLNALQDCGVPVFGVIAENLEQLTDSMDNLGKALEEEETAESFCDIYADTTALVQGRTSSLSTDARPVVYLVGPAGVINTCTGDMYQSDLIEIAGGKNAAENESGTRWVEIDVETIVDSNPDIILLVQYQSLVTPADIINDERFKDITAVKNHQVYVFPSNICPWDYPSPEAVLGIEWLAKTLHPDLFGDIDVVTDADAFYEEFYGTTFTDLGGTLPATNFPGNAVTAFASAAVQAVA